ncbi:MAG: hypothetical protein M0017_08750 [Desulfobacteraceae bacterium]|nr:hypothetical protein [Desulfobacteraceae bacterium]
MRLSIPELHVQGHHRRPPARKAPRRGDPFRPVFGQERRPISRPGPPHRHSGHHPARGFPKLRIRPDAPTLGFHDQQGRTAAVLGQAGRQGLDCGEVRGHVGSWWNQ